MSSGNSSSSDGPCASDTAAITPAGDAGPSVASSPDPKRPADPAASSTAAKITPRTPLARALMIAVDALLEIAQEGSVGGRSSNAPTSLRRRDDNYVRQYALEAVERVNAELEEGF